LGLPFLRIEATGHSRDSVIAVELPSVKVGVDCHLVLWINF
jgi:hypothetical protein